MNWLALIGMTVVSYLLGSFPSGIVLGRLLKGIDLRQYGSGKTGATNSLRTLGWQISLAVFLLDFGKGALAVLLAQHTFFPPEYQPWATLVMALACMLGHDYSIFIRFSGGRGAATGLGELFAVSPLALLIIFVVGLPIIAITRYVSLASIVGSVLGPIAILVAAVVTGLDWRYIFFAIVCGGLIVIKHADNIQRLLNGTERKLGEKAKPTTDSASTTKQGATK
jgi:glycerol-3-phosphate acyltransferase PlsY